MRLTACISFIVFGYAAILNGQPSVRIFEDQDYQLEIAFWYAEEDLPTWKVFDMVEDERGFMWLGTNLGLIRFDGEYFKMFDKLSLKKPISYVAIDVNRRVWLFSIEKNTGEAEVNIFDPLTEEVMSLEAYTGIAPSIFKNNYLRGYRILKMPDAIWIIDNFGGKAWKYDGILKQMLNDPVQHAFEEFDYLPRKDGLFWLNVTNGYNADSLKVIDATGQVIWEKEKLDRDYNLLLDAEYRLWDYSRTISKTDTCFLSVIHQLERKEEPEGITIENWEALVTANTWLTGVGNTIQLNDRGVGFVGIERNHFFLKKGQRLFDDIDDLLAKEYDAAIIRMFWKDKAGNFWFVCPTGLFRLNVKSKLFKTYSPEDLPPISCRGLVSVGDSLLFVNSYSGTFKVDLKTEEFTDIPSYRDNTSGRGIYKDGNTLWLGNDGMTMYQYDIEKDQLGQSVTLKNPSISHHGGNMLFMLNDSTILQGGVLGISKATKGSSVAYIAGLNNKHVSCFHENKEGLWVGTDEGLFLCDQELQVQNHWALSRDSIFKTHLYDLHEDEEGMFWLGTNKGLLRWRPFSAEWDAYSTENGFINDHVHAVYEDTLNNLWLPTNKGLVKFNKDNKLIETYLKQDGLPSSEFNLLSHHRREDGYLFLGGVNGVLGFYPDRIKTLDHQLKVAFADVWTINIDNGNEINKTKAAVEKSIIEITPDERRLNVQLISKCLEAGERVVYQWRIPHQSKQWEQIDQPFLQINNLDYGTYSIEFRAYMEGNTTNDIPISRLQLHVRLPFYRTTWFYGICVLFLLIMAHVINQWRQKRLIQYNLRLQQQVNEQTARLREQLTTIEQLAENLKKQDKAKSRFFANVSHELRTPLSLVIDPLRAFVRHTDLTVKQQAQIERIKKNAEQLEQLTEEILDLTRLDANLLKCQEKAVDFNKFINSIYHIYTSLANYREIGFFLKNEVPAASIILMDDQKVERIINNLLGNAIKFTPKGGRIYLKAKLRSERLIIEVEDSGIGIEGEKLAAIFDRYYQVDNDSETMNGGLGIGLALSKEIAKLMKGQLRVESIYGKGSRFILSLPIKELDQKTIALKEQPFAVKPKTADGNITIGAPAKNGKSLTQPHLLLVEDNVDLLDYLNEILQDAYRLTLAKNGKIALSLMKEHNFDLIVSDVMMPEMDGFQLLESVRSQTSHFSIPFVLLTARASLNDKLHGMRLGVDLYLRKPFESLELKTGIQNLLSNQEKRKKYFTRLNSLQNSNRSTLQQEECSIKAFDQLWLEKLESVVKKELSNTNLRVEALASAMQVSERTFRSKLKLYTGLTPQQYIVTARLHQAQRLMEQMAYPSVAEIAYACGFSSPAYFTSQFKKQFGKVPSAYMGL